jgi:predicted Zn-dependent protease
MNPDLIPIAAAVRVADWAEAERLVRALLRGDDAREDLLTMLAISLQMQGRASEAVEAYEQLTRLFPARSEHWGNYATALREAGRLDEAAAVYERVLHASPTDAGQLVNYALLKLQQRDYAGARDIALRAHALEPDSPRVRIHAARACQACREYEEAEDLLKPWRRWLPLEDDGLQQELGDLQLALGDGDSAQVLLEDLVRRSPGNVHAIVHLASAYERLNRLPEAESLLAQLAGRLDGAAPGVRMELAHVLAKVAQRKGDLAEAQAILEDAGLRGEGDYAHHYLLAEIRAKRNDVAGTMQALEAAHALHVEDLKHVIPKRFEPGASPLPLADVRGDADA